MSETNGTTRARNAANLICMRERLQRVSLTRSNSASTRVNTRGGAFAAPESGAETPTHARTHLRGADGGEKAEFAAESWWRRKRVRSRLAAVFTGGGVAGGRNWPRVLPQAHFGHYHVRERPKIAAACDFLGEGQQRRRGLAGR